MPQGTYNSSTSLSQGAYNHVQVRIEDERITTEQKFERKMEIITRELSRREFDLSQVPCRPITSPLSQLTQCSIWPSGYRLIVLNGPLS